MVFCCLCCAIVHRNHFIRFYQQNKFSEFKVKFSQASTCCKSLLEASKLIYANKTKVFLKLPNLYMLIKQESIISQKLGSRNFWQIANSVLNKGKTAIPRLLNRPDVLSSESDKAKLLAKNISKNSNLVDSGTQVSLCLFSLLELF